MRLYKLNIKDGVEVPVGLSIDIYDGDGLACGI